MRARPASPGAGSPSTSCCVCRSRSSCASAPRRARRAASPTTSQASPGGVRLVEGFLSALPFSSPRRRRRDRRDRHDLALVGADAPAAAGRRRVGQDGRRARGVALRRPGRLPGRLHGADRGPRRAALPRRPAAARRARRSRRAGASAGRGRWRRPAHEPAAGMARAPAASTSSPPGGRPPRRDARAASPRTVEFSSLGVVVIDEQHRFGVDQRAALREKGSAAGALGHDPDLLVMTATPIPRTAAMTVYGDLDYSVLRRAAAGAHAGARRAGSTTTRPRPRRGNGSAPRWPPADQAFVVCPLVATDAVDDDGLSLAAEDGPTPSTTTGGFDTEASRPSVTRRGRRGRGVRAPCLGTSCGGCGRPVARPAHGRRTRRT